MEKLPRFHIRKWVSKSETSNYFNNASLRLRLALTTEFTNIQGGKRCKKQNHVEISIQKNSIFQFEILATLMHTSTQLSDKLNVIYFNRYKCITVPPIFIKTLHRILREDAFLFLGIDINLLSQYRKMKTEERRCMLLDMGL